MSVIRRRRGRLPFPVTRQRCGRLPFPVTLRHCSRLPFPVGSRLQRRRFTGVGPSVDGSRKSVQALTRSL
ncbi:hypothetical protein EYF80_067951 [Liparis tanakae]|uniref:Uncharacterized protein n=1 Tax=Liparis tanakae TaxID=230148 RepID=A0A4Z2DZS3_9TELE|nr:hypothetical protein EYF80_067951 [Liparis tanakae]